MQTVAPAGTFEKKARSLLGADGYETLVADIARNPLAGVLIKGSGGLRKLRVAAEGGGKSGGMRVIYYYHSKNKPIWLMLIFAKSAQSNITDSQKNRLKVLIDILKKSTR